MGHLNLGLMLPYLCIRVGARMTRGFDCDNFVLDPTCVIMCEGMFGVMDHDNLY